ncbi:MAG: sigma factor-like helix-turn-helix DNA-binding protein, partial [Planctomycetota bacterium]|nr:sigma factor-like helix-turn-helix DNA-binding protein [Planctomycetota bacterium]
GLSYDEAADRLRLPIGTVRSRTSRARAALNRMLTDHASETEAC